MNEIGGTFKWSEEQIKAYAATFREGDAVKVDGEGWVEVKTHNAVWGEYLAAGDPDGAMLNAAGKGSCGAFLQGGGSCVVVTPKDYEVKEGDKLVRLGKTVEQYSQSELTFGKVYEVVRWHEDGELVYKNDMTTALLASYLKEEDGAWGVIPRYKNVKEETGGEVVLANQVEYSGKFEVGDRVRHASVVFEDEQKYLGESGTVVEVNASQEPLPCIVKFDTGVLEGFNEAELDLIESESVKKEEGEMTKGVKCKVKFKVGDVVRVNETDSRYEGCVGEVDGIHATDNDTTCDIVFADGSFCWVYANDLELVEGEEGMNSKCERSGNVGKFKKGDRVRVTGGYYKGWEGSIDRSAKVGGEHSCSVSFGGRHGFRWVEEELLELVEKVEKSPEQEAFEYLLTLDKTLVRIFLTDEINDWAKEYMKQKDYNSAKRAIEILEKLEKGE